MKGFFLCCVFLCATLQRNNRQTHAVPATALNSCEGDILLLLDSSGSVSNYEFSRFLLFAADLLHPFSLGRGHIRVALLQVGTSPHLEFGLDAHKDKNSLQKALQGVSQLQGDTNTEMALEMAQRILTEGNVPKILLWLTDGVHPGNVDRPMSELKAQGVSVLAVYTIHGNYRVLQRVVTPPVETHLYSVDIDSIDIITEDLRRAIIKIICSEWLKVVDLTSHSAVLQWHPVLNADSGYYELRYNSARKTNPDIRQILSGATSKAELTNLQPETTYTASLRPESNQRLFNTLSVNFTTLPDILSPAEVSLSESGPHQIRVSWGPLQPAWVQTYTLEYGAIPSGRVHTMTFPSQKTSALLADLEPGTQYLVTISALYADGKERAMSVRACTQEALPALVDLQLAPVEQQEVEVEEVQAIMHAHEEGLKGYWVSWEKKNSQSSPSKRTLSSIYLPPSTPSVRLTHLALNSRVCVSPVYSSGRGDGVCCTAKTHSGWLS
ncbi:von Willebrand factor A domain-containing protein 1-like [Melanotaenia boesemani]|uniref:von Willebrand factor A domain-containing protein 1-like n=1 Tax=Melanotaenia boesemani TaxID=1250792 RepID=UPI001C04530C|nr:von Willebrand factor A domain-containing protein 1-like [Melanotaenia boesemani]